MESLRTLELRLCRSWRLALAGDLVLALLVALLALTASGCASGGQRWRPFSVSCTVLDKATVAVPAPPGDPPRPDRYVVFLECAGRSLTGDTDAAFYARVQRGTCAQLVGQGRGHRVRSARLRVPCDPPRPPAQKGLDT